MDLPKAFDFIPHHYTRVPTVMENPGKSWKKSCHGKSWKVMENSKNSKCHGNLFARKKVMEISCPNPPNRGPIVL